MLRSYKVEAVRRGTLISGRAVARDFVLAAHLAEWVDEATAAVASRKPRRSSMRAVAEKASNKSRTFAAVAVSPAGCDPGPWFQMSLGGEALGSDGRHTSCRRRCGPFFLDLGEQPDLQRRGGLPSRRIIMREAARLEDYGAQLGDAAATSVVEVYERQAGRGIASCRSAITGAAGRRCLRLRYRRAPTRQCPPSPLS